MADAFLRFRGGEKRPIYGQITATSGTLTIQAGGTCTLYDAAGSAVTGIVNVAVTGYDLTALAAPRAWYNIDTGSTGPAGALAAGMYSLAFKFQAAGSDSLTRTYEPVIAFQVAALP